MASGRGHQHVAIEDPDMPEALANRSPEFFEPGILNRHRAIGLARPHPQLTLDEGAHVAALEIVHDIETEFNAVKALLNQHTPLRIRGADLGEGAASDVLRGQPKA